MTVYMHFPRYRLAADLLFRIWTIRRNVVKWFFSCSFMLLTWPCWNNLHKERTSVRKVQVHCYEFDFNQRGCFVIGNPAGNISCADTYAYHEIKNCEVRTTVIPLGSQFRPNPWPRRCIIHSFQYVCSRQVCKRWNEVIKTQKLSCRYPRWNVLDHLQINTNIKIPKVIDTISNPAKCSGLIYII